MRTVITCTCIRCGKEFPSSTYDVKRGRNAHCSTSCAVNKLSVEEEDNLNQIFITKYHTETSINAEKKILLDLERKEIDIKRQIRRSKANLKELFSTSRKTANPNLGVLFGLSKHAIYARYRDFKDAKRRNRDV